MDKVEYKIKYDEIKSLVEMGAFQEAVEIADEIDWRKVKSVKTLCMISDIYKINRRYEDARNIMLLAYEKNPGSRTIVFNLCELSIKIGDLVMALEYCKEYAQLAPHDIGKHILTYKMYKAQGVGLEEQIAILEELKSYEYREKWAYELAYLYHRVGLDTKCVQECDEIFLWFGEGKYVIEALELKKLHTSLTPQQQVIYDHRFDEDEVVEETEVQEELLTENSEEAAADGSEENSEETNADMDILNAPTTRIPVEEIQYQIQSFGNVPYDTINLQQEIADGIKPYLDKEEVSVDQFRFGAEPEEETFAYEPAVEDELPKELENALSMESDGQISLVVPEQTVVEKQITGQMSIEDILKEWEDIKNRSKEQSIQSVQRKLSDKTGQMFDEYEASIRDGLLEKIEKGEHVEGIIIPEYKGVEFESNHNREEDFYEEDSFLKDSDFDYSVDDDEVEEIRTEEDLNKSAEDTYEDIPEAVEESVEATSEDVVEEQAEEVTEEYIEEAEQEQAEAATEEYEEEASEEYTEEASEEYTGEVPEEYAEEATEEYTEEAMQEQAEEATEEYEEEASEEYAEEASEEYTGEATEEYTEEATEEYTEEAMQEQAEEATEEYIEEAEQDQTEDGEATEEYEEETSEEYAEETSEEYTGEASEEYTEETSEEYTEETSEEYEEEDYISETSEDEYEEETCGSASVVDETAEEMIVDYETREIPIIEDSDLQSEKVRALTPEEEDLFRGYVDHPRARKMLTTALDAISLAPYTGNVIITGEDPQNCFRLTKCMIKDLQATDANFTGKIAKVSGKAMNDRDVFDTFDKLKSGALIIQGVTAITDETANAMYKALQHDNYGILIIMEDTRKAMKHFMEKHRDLEECFTSRMEVRSLSDKDLVKYGIDYAKEQEYSIDEMGTLEFHTIITSRQTSDHLVSKAEVRDIVDQAIAHAKKITIGHFFDIIFAKRYDENDMVILRDKDFKGID